jgi:hypothetical protein
MNFHHSHNTIPSFKTIVVFGNNYSWRGNQKTPWRFCVAIFFAGFLNTPV